jgi:hypothetical protein
MLSVMTASVNPSILLVIHLMIINHRHRSRIFSESRRVTSLCCDRFTLQGESLEDRRMLAGDFDGNGFLAVADIERLSHEVRIGSNDLRFDLDGNGVVDQEDRRYWVENIAGTYFGDANLDGQFNSSDLVHVFQANDYEDNFALNSSWDTGDFDGDREFSTSDLVLAFQRGRYEGQVRTRVQISELSPAAGEDLVSLTRETIVRFSGEIQPNTVTPFHISV